MKWVILSCGHGAWVPWLEAFPGREVMCPGPGTSREAGYWRCARVSQRVVQVVDRIWPSRSEARTA